MMSSTATLGLILLWDIDGGLTQIDKYLYSSEDYIKVRNIFFLLLFPWLFQSCRVADMTDDLPSPHRPVRLLARSQSCQLFKSRWHAFFHLVFGHLFQKEVVYPSSTLSPVCVLHLSSSSFFCKPALFLECIRF